METPHGFHLIKRNQILHYILNGNHGRGSQLLKSSRTPTGVDVKASSMEFAQVELQTNDREHKDGKEKQQTNLQKRDHGLHDGFEHHLQAWRTSTVFFQV